MMSRFCFSVANVLVEREKKEETCQEVLSFDAQLTDSTFTG
jgi:hypothetical protein